MLELNDTALLLDALRPPAGMQIEIAVGTTFTLDLTALLTIPVAATFDEAQRGEDGADLLATLQRYADRTVLFCQAGAISVPPRYRAAHTFIEQTVVEVAKPDGGIFHPKAWMLRFGGGGRQRHRIVVMSRNLTFDRAWDVLVRLDEEPGIPARSAVRSKGIVAFLEALPARAIRGRLSSTQLSLLRDLASTLRRARFAVPEPFTSGKFAPLLGAKTGLPFYRGATSSLAVSPFLTAGAAARFTELSSGRVRVVSRAGAINSSASGLVGTEVLRIKDLLANVQDSVDGEDPAEPTPAMRGLHAKVYVQDFAGSDSTVWLGSANLTDRAFRTNVELLVELSGPRRKVGTEVVLERNPRKGNLSWLVEPVDLPGVDGPEDSEISEIEGVAYHLASQEFIIRYEAVGSDRPDLWTAKLSAAAWEPPAGATVKVELFSLRRDSADFAGGEATWTDLIRTEITPFVVFTVSRDASSRRVLIRAQITGDPPDRRGSVLAGAITSTDDFMRYLAALLGRPNGFGAGGGTQGFEGWVGGLRGDRVLEDLLFTASRNPGSLASLDHTLRYLERDPGTAGVVPPDFRKLWDAVYAARKREIG
jgi:hypothetical protein